MIKDSNACLQTGSEIFRCLEKLAVQGKQSIASVVESIISRHLKDNSTLEGLYNSRRRSERMKVYLPAYVGDPRWQRGEFISANVVDLSFGGIGFAIPKGSRLEIQGNEENSEFRIIFTLPNTLWPINIRVLPRSFSECDEGVRVGASFVNPDFYACATLQKYLM
jgi:hypothetical protein